jgi:small subunit ribosomal protein S11
MLKGPGNGRESAIRSLHNGGIEARDYRCYPMPHNGCRPQKDVEFNNILV